MSLGLRRLTSTHVSNPFTKNDRIETRMMKLVAYSDCV
jgi:hypothetical protein